MRRSYLCLVSFSQDGYIAFQIAFYLRQAVSFLERDEAPFVTKLVVGLFVYSAKVDKKFADQQISLNEIFVINLKTFEYVNQVV
jgi:hypothetical protein